MFNAPVKMFGERHAPQLYVLDSQTIDHRRELEQLDKRDHYISVGAFASLGQHCAPEEQPNLRLKADKVQPNFGRVSSILQLACFFFENERLTK
jgi:hypothetical protein